MNENNLSDEDIFLIFWILKQDPEKWGVLDFRHLGPWKHTGNDVSYLLLPEFQVMSTVEREPVFSGDFVTEKDVGERRDLGSYVCFLDFKQNVLMIMDGENEIKTKAWWLRTKYRYSHDWATASWEEI